MKKVRMIVNVSGTRDGVDWPKIGESLTVSPAEAADLIRGRLAVDPDAPEVALAPGVEAAVMPKVVVGNKSIRAQRAAK